MHQYCIPMDLTVEFIDSENEVEIDNLELPPTQGYDVEIIENSDLEFVQASEAEDSFDRLLQAYFNRLHRRPKIGTQDWSIFLFIGPFVFAVQILFSSAL